MCCAHLQEILDAFISQKIVNGAVLQLNKAAVWSFTSDSSRVGQCCLVEPIIENFIKFNSNTGWASNDLKSWGGVMAVRDTV